MTEKNVPNVAEMSAQKGMSDTLCTFFVQGRPIESSIKTAIKNGIPIPAIYLTVPKSMQLFGAPDVSNTTNAVSDTMDSSSVRSTVEPTPRENQKKAATPKKAASISRSVQNRPESNNSVRPNPEHIKRLKLRAEIRKTLRKIPKKPPPRPKVFTAKKQTKAIDHFCDDYFNVNETRVKWLPDMVIDPRLAEPQETTVNSLDYGVSEVNPQKSNMNCASIEFTVEKTGRFDLALRLEQSRKTREYFSNYDKIFLDATKESRKYHRSGKKYQPPRAAFTYGVYKDSDTNGDKENGTKEKEPLSNDPESDKLAYEEYRKRLDEKLRLKAKKTIESAKKYGGITIDTSSTLSGKQEIAPMKSEPVHKENLIKDTPSSSVAAPSAPAPVSVTPSTSSVNPFKASQMALPKMSLDETVPKKKKRVFGDWSLVIANANEYHKKSISGARSETSSSSLREDAARLTWNDPNKVEEVRVVAKVAQIAEKSNVVEKPTTSAESSSSEPIVAKVQEDPKPAKKGRGRPRKKPAVTDDSVQITQPDIVVESALPAPQPHQFPRPDLEPFVASQPSQMLRPDCQPFMAQTPKDKTTEPEEPQFARPKASADMERVRGSLKAGSIEKTNEKNVSNAGSIETISIKSVESEGPPAAKKRKPSSAQNVENVVNNSQLLPPSVPKARPSRSSRSYLSKNNPKPRHRRTEKLANDHEQESNSSRNANNESDDAVSRTSSFSQSQSQIGKKVAGGMDSCASSRLGDFEDLTWPGKSVVAQQFGDPQPPPEVTIDEDAEAKPNVEEMPTPPPINETSRSSIKRKRKEAEAENAVKTEIEDQEGVECLLTIKGVPKEEDIEDDDCVIIPAYVVPAANPKPIAEVDRPPPMPAEVPEQGLTHSYAINSHIYKHLNGLFSGDPLQFCQLVKCILEDKNRTGKTFLVSAEIKNRKSDYSQEFIKFLASSPKDGELVDPQWKTYSNYTSEFRSRCSGLKVYKNGLTAKDFFECIEQIQEMMKRLRRNVPSYSVSSSERELMNVVENILIGRFIMSTLSMASMAHLAWQTDDHMKRRLQLLLNGWNEFILRGGVFRVILAMDRDDVKPANPEFLSVIKTMLEECKHNVSVAAELLDLSEHDLTLKLARECEFPVEKLEAVDRDMRPEGSETHLYKCARCKNNNEFDVFFSSQDTLDDHILLHGSAECPLCFDDCPSNSGVLLHTINMHFSIRNDYA